MGLGAAGRLRLLVAPKSAGLVLGQDALRLDALFHSADPPFGVRGALKIIHRDRFFIPVLTSAPGEVPNGPAASE